MWLKRAKNTGVLLPCLSVDRIRGGLGFVSIMCASNSLDACTKVVVARGLENNEGGTFFSSRLLVDSLGDRH